MKLPFVRVYVNREHKLPFLQVFDLTRTMNERLRAVLPDVETVVSITGRDDISIEGRPEAEIAVIEAIYREIWLSPEW